MLRAAAADFYQLRWSNEILDEMERNLVSTGTVPADKAARLRATMERFFPEAMVTGYEPLIAAMQNDMKDRHVVAAAVKSERRSSSPRTSRISPHCPTASRPSRPTSSSATCSTSILRASPTCSESRRSICRTQPTTRLLCYAAESWQGYRGGPFLKAQAALRRFGIDVSKAADIRRYRVDVTRVWERRECGWFIHTYRYVPEQLVRVITRSDGHEVPIYGSPRYERASTKQASKKEIRDAQRLLERDPLYRTSR